MSKQPQNQLIFKAIPPREGFQWSGNIDQAFMEFFKSKEKQQQMIIKKMQVLEEEWQPEPELGSGEENAFIATNGVKIWWEKS